MKYVRSFFAFLYDFLVGDQWELFVGPLVIVGVCAALVGAGVSGAVVGLVFFASVVGVIALNMAISLRHAA